MYDNAFGIFYCKNNGDNAKFIIRINIDISIGGDNNINN